MVDATSSDEGYDCPRSITHEDDKIRNLRERVIEAIREQVECVQIASSSPDMAAHHAKAAESLSAALAHLKAVCP